VINILLEIKSNVHFETTFFSKVTLIMKLKSIIFLNLCEIIKRVTPCKMEGVTNPIVEWLKKVPTSLGVCCYEFDFLLTYGSSIQHLTTYLGRL